MGSGRRVCAKKRSFEVGAAGVVLDALDAVLVARGPESVIRCTDREFRTSKRAGRIPIDRRLLQPPRHHSALGVVTALSQPFDQLPGVFSQRLARFIAQIMHMAATIDFQLQPS